MRRRLLLLAVGALCLVASVSAQAAPFTLNFSEAIALNDPDAASLAGNEFNAYGIGTLGAYLYRDSVNDPFGDGSYGLSVDFNEDFGPLAFIVFENLQSSIEYDWALIPDSDMTTVAFDDNLALLDFHYYDGSAYSGHDTYNVAGIQGMAFFTGSLNTEIGGVGLASISTLTYDRPVGPVPEPATFLLLGLGGLGALAFRRRRA